MAAAPSAEPIRIVPLRGAEAPAAAPAPRLVYEGGPLLAAVEVITIFWGSWWATPGGVELAGQLNGFFDFVLTSELIDQLAEYDVSGFAIGHGRRTGTTTVGSPEPSGSIEDVALRQELQELVGGGTVPAVSANTLYFLYLPPGVAVEQGGSRSCQGFCGYHDAVDGKLFYAVMPYPGCAGCVGGLPVLGALTTTSSHELCEAITDPVPGQGWYDQVHGEIGDICAWQTKPLGSFTVQLEWSNRHGACV